MVHLYFQLVRCHLQEGYGNKAGEGSEEAMKIIKGLEKPPIRKVKETVFSVKRRKLRRDIKLLNT